MWHPKQLLKEPIVAALLLGGFDPLQIEFLGWLSYNARALNNSRNPVKAAHTILAKVGVEDGMTRMMETFRTRKMESIRPPEAETHEEADQVFADLRTEIQAHLHDAQITGHGYTDYTKGGISDGGLPLGEEEAADAAEENGDE